MSAFNSWWLHLSWSHAAFWLCVWTLGAYAVARFVDAMVRAGNREVPPAPDAKCAADSKKIMIYDSHTNAHVRVVRIHPENNNEFR